MKLIAKDERSIRLRRKLESELIEINCNNHKLERSLREIIEEETSFTKKNKSYDIYQQMRSVLSKNTNNLEECYIGAVSISEVTKIMKMNSFDKFREEEINEYL